MSIRSFASFMTFFALAGCMSPGSQYGDPQGQQVLDAMLARCRGQGFQEGTDAFIGCMRAQVDNAYGGGRTSPAPAPSSGGCVVILCSHNPGAVSSAK